MKISSIIIGEIFYEKNVGMERKIEVIRTLSIEKKCDKNGEIYDLACYDENENGARIDILRRFKNKEYGYNSR